MARHVKRRRRKMGRYIKGSVQHTQVVTVPFTTLDVQSQIFGEVVNERTLISSIVATYGLSAVTPVIGVGPMIIGVSHSDYTAAEIEQYLENVNSWNEGNLSAQEIAGRKIRRIGAFDSADNQEDTIVFNDGKPIKTKLNWILLQGQSLNSWCYNGGPVSFITTTPTLIINGHANLWPQ